MLTASRGQLPPVDLHHRDFQVRCRLCDELRKGEHPPSIVPSSLVSATDTPLPQIEALRVRMLEFLETERRDFRPYIDLSVEDFAQQGSLSLTATINYRGNWQNVSRKMQRRNKWICALRVALAELQIFGPLGAGDPARE